MKPTECRFRVYDPRVNKILTDSSHFVATVQRHNGVATVFLDRDDLVALFWTGEQAGGVDVYDGDIVEAMVDGELVTDEVHKDGSAWRLGTHVGALSDFNLVRVVTNRYISPWPRAAE